MKNLIYVFITASTLILSSCSKDTETAPEALNSDVFLKTSLIVDNLDGTKTITGANLLEMWSKEQTALSDTTINFKTVTVERIEDENGKMLENQVFVKSTSVDGRVSIGAIFTQGSDGNFTRGKECTCTSTCGQGCELSIFENNCRCSDCIPGSSGDCTKTEKLIIDK